MDILPYQDKPDPWSSHSVILNWLAEFDPQTRILDVGTASGTLGRLSPKAV
jgi:tRNA1(Val) A37 N6-methylase TrmN6